MDRTARSTDAPPRPAPAPHVRADLVPPRVFPASPATSPARAPRARPGGRSATDGEGRALDGPHSAAQLDFLRGIQRKAEFIEAGFPAGLAARAPGLQADALLFVGMGGSGAAAMLVRDAAARVLATPTSLLQHDELPRCVNDRTHLLAVSHSGETEETLSVVRQARQAGCGVTAFSAGGTLLTLGDRHIQQPAGYAPRIALPHVWFSILGFLQGSGFLPEPVPVREAAEAVREVDAACGPQVPMDENPAKQVGETFHRLVAQVYVTPSFAGMGRLFTSLLNENAKRIAHVDDIPETNHNALTGWGGDPRRRHFAALVLSHGAERLEVRRRIEFMAQRHHDWQVPWHEHVVRPVTGFGEHVVEQARMHQFLDYVSYYAAVLRDVDPAEIKEVRGLKQYLRTGTGGDDAADGAPPRWQPAPKAVPAPDGSVSSVR